MNPSDPPIATPPAAEVLDATRMRTNNAMGIDFMVGGALGLLSAVGLRSFPLPEEVPGYVAIGLFVLYFFFGNALPGGSLGMRLFGLSVVSARTLRPAGAHQVLLRTLFHPLHLGDAVARTRVVMRSSIPARVSQPESPLSPS